MLTARSNPGAPPVQIKLVCLEDGITSCGFRKMAAYVARLNPDTESCYVSTNSYRSVRGALAGTMGTLSALLDDEQVDEIAQGAARIGPRRLLVDDRLLPSSRASVIQRVRELDPSAYIIWGGIHPIIHPEDAILADVDAICTGEGEFAFEEFLDAPQGRAATSPERRTSGSTDGRTATSIKNRFLPLMTPRRWRRCRSRSTARPARRSTSRARASSPIDRRRLPAQRRPRLPGAVVDRLPVPLHLLRQHEVHRQRPEVQAHPPPERALHRRRGQGRARALPASQPGELPRRQLHGDPVPGARGVRRAVAGRARPAVRRLRRDPELREARQVRDAHVGGHEPHPHGHPERQPGDPRLLQAPDAAREDPGRRQGHRARSRRSTTSRRPTTSSWTTRSRRART